MSAGLQYLHEAGWSYHKGQRGEMPYVPGNQKCVFGLPPRHRHGKEAAVVGVADLGIVRLSRGDVQTDRDQPLYDDFHRFGRKAELFPRQDASVLGEDLPVQQGHRFSAEDGEQDCAWIGIEVQQRGDQNIRADDGIKYYRPALAAEISALISSNVICALPLA